MSKIVRPIEAFVGETVRITWRRQMTVGPHTYKTGQTLEEDHIAPPPDVWHARVVAQEAEQALLRQQLGLSGEKAPDQ